jgi:flagellar protein FliO/FliZ
MQRLMEQLGLGEGAASMAVFVGLGLALLILVIVLANWLIRAMLPSLNMSSGRGARPQRLAITEAFNLDRDGRRLVIIRRDNTEHLILIGGPNDVLIEQNILRSERLNRPGRSEPIDPMPEGTALLAPGADAPRISTERIAAAPHGPDFCTGPSSPPSAPAAQRSCSQFFAPIRIKRG